MTENGPVKTRAHGRTRARAAEILVRGVRIPKPSRDGSRVAQEWRRVPLVLVDVERDGLRMVFAVARLRGGVLDIRPPRGPDGTGAGIWLPARERERIGAAILAAVKADPEVRTALRLSG